MKAKMEASVLEHCHFVMLLLRNGGYLTLQVGLAC